MSQPKPDTAVDLADSRFSSGHIIRDTIISALVVLAVVIFLVANSGAFADTLRLLAKASPQMVLFGAVLVLGTYVAAAISYVALADSAKVRLLPTLAIQTASGITNRLLPAGLGGAGLYVLYFKKRGFRYSKSTAIVAANNILGATGNLILLCIAVALSPKPEQLLNLKSLPASFAIGAAVCLGVLLLVLFLKRSWLERIRDFIRDTLHSLRTALRPSKRTAVSLGSNMALTSLNCLILCLAVAATGSSMFWPLAVAVLSIGALLGAAVPTPGGLGGVEAGIVGGLVACGVPPAPALAATLIYRALTYWLPVIPGIAALPWVRKRYLR